MSRRAKIIRKTTETDINLEIDFDKTAGSRIDTTIPFFDHMLELFARHGLSKLIVKSKGDTKIDDHHLIEDLGICLGKVVGQVLDKKKGINRYGSASVPMDECFALHFRDGITASEFCEFSGHLKAGVSRAVIALERKRLIRRRTDAADNRRQRLFLTNAGRTIYRSYIPALKAREKAMLACLSSSERQQFDRLLDKLALHVPHWGSPSEL